MRIRAYSKQPEPQQEGRKLGLPKLEDEGISSQTEFIRQQGLDHQPQFYGQHPNACRLKRRRRGPVEHMCKLITAFCNEPGEPFPVPQERLDYSRHSPIDVLDAGSQGRLVVFDSLQDPFGLSVSPRLLRKGTFHPIRLEELSNSLDKLLVVVRRQAIVVSRTAMVTLYGEDEREKVLGCAHRRASKRRKQIDDRTIRAARSMPPIDR